MADLVALSSPFSSGGTFTVQGAIYAKWVALAQQKTAGGVQNVQSYLGYPLAEELDVPADRGGGTAQTFQRGMIVARTDRSAFVVYGAIYLRYAALGDIGSVLGLPISDEESAPGGGRVSKFAGGDIYWSGGSGAHEVHGAIRERYLQLGGPGGMLGFPTTCETAVMRGGKEVGASIDFLTMAPSTVRRNRRLGCLWTNLAAWEGQAKGVNGQLGFPIAAQGRIPAGIFTSGITANVPETDHGTFERGAVVWHSAGRPPGPTSSPASSSSSRTSKRRASIPSGRTSALRAIGCTST